MNKIKMGKFLKELRLEHWKEKKFTLQELSKKFQNDFLNVSAAAINKWERGESIPDIDNLNFLAELFNVSIDEILDGERKINISFEDKYFLHKSDWLKTHSFDPDKEYFEIIREQKKLIRKNIKELCLKYLNNDCSKSDNDELMFLISNYYNCASNVEDKAIFRKLKLLKDGNESVDSKWWETQKLFSPIRLLDISIASAGDECYKSKLFQKTFASFEDWQKDMFLASFEVEDFVYIDRGLSSKSLSAYKKETGKEFDRERIAKETIKFLISNGAVINKNYLGCSEEIKIRTRIIDEIEKRYNAVKKPIELVIRDDKENNVYYRIENTSKNRLLTKYRYSIVKPLLELNYSYDEIYRMVMGNSEMIDEVVLRLASKKGVDTNRDVKYIRADLSFDTMYLNSEWKEFYCLEKDLRIKESEIEKLTKLLNDGETEVVHSTCIYRGGRTSSERESFVKEVNKNLSLEQFSEGRDHKMTKQLIKDIDLLPLDEIRAKYFNKGEHQDD